MTVHQKLLDVLVCPACKGELQQVRGQGDDASSPAPPSSTSALVALDCRQCRLRFPVVDEIPVMLLDQAQRLTD